MFSKSLRLFYVSRLTNFVVYVIIWVYSVLSFQTFHPIHFFVSCCLSSVMFWRSKGFLRPVPLRWRALWPVGYGSAGVWVLACRPWQSCGGAGCESFLGSLMEENSTAERMLSLSLPQQRPAGPAFRRSPHRPRHHVVLWLVQHI